MGDISWTGSRGVYGVTGPEFQDASFPDFQNSPLAEPLTPATPGPHEGPSPLLQSGRLAANPGQGMGRVMGLDGEAPGSAGV